MIMKNCLALPFAMLLLLTLAAHADSGYDSGSMSQIVGVTSSKFYGNLNPTKRHAECAQDFPGSHWCDTREFLNGGRTGDVDQKLPTAWIRPSIIAASKLLEQETVYTDVSGLQVPASRLNCNQWSSDSGNDGGLALQTNKDELRQVVIANDCSAKLEILCCASQ